MTWIKRRLPEGRQSGAMFGRRLTLFELLGFKVQVDASWIFLAVLVVWPLAAGVFPARLEGLPAVSRRELPLDCAVSHHTLWGSCALQSRLPLLVRRVRAPRRRCQEMGAAPQSSPLCRTSSRRPL